MTWLLIAQRHVARVVLWRHVFGGWFFTGVLPTGVPPSLVGRMWGRRVRRDPRGSVTAETAVAFPALVVVLAVALWGVSAAAAQVACVDAARAGARAAARGEPETEVRAAVLRAAPPEARVTLSRDPLTTKVMVQAEVRPPLKGLFPALPLQAQAIAATEPEGRDGNPPGATADNGGPPHGASRRR
ncbi:MAG: hypothetical protein JWP48_3679 [Actinoallomurus sp.]|jgi:hypothetical protein|nr:hypothetical protein [Actinoallomurus sp.]